MSKVSSLKDAKALVDLINVANNADGKYAESDSANAKDALRRYSDEDLEAAKELLAKSSDRVERSINAIDGEIHSRQWVQCLLFDDPGLFEGGQSASPMVKYRDGLTGAVFEVDCGETHMRFKALVSEGKRNMALSWAPGYEGLFDVEVHVNQQEVVRRLKAGTLPAALKAFVSELISPKLFVEREKTREEIDDGK